jgi:hypothetical protein
LIPIARSWLWKLQVLFWPMFPVLLTALGCFYWVLVFGVDFGGGIAQDMHEASLTFSFLLPFSARVIEVVADT